MARRLGIAALWGVLGYVVGAFGGGFLISQVSSNTHDLSVEAAMTGAFVVGPIVAGLAAFVGFLRSKPS